MKNVILMCCITFAAGNAAAAEYRFVNGDDSALSELCLAALDSSLAMEYLADDLNIDDVSVDNLACNGLPLGKFVRKYRTVDRQPEARYAFTRNDSSPETQLCHAAVTSPQRFDVLKREFFAGERDLETRILCNELPLKTFVKKYRNREFTAGLQ